MLNHPTLSRRTMLGGLGTAALGVAGAGAVGQPAQATLPPPGPTVLYVSSLGFDPDDSTSYLQAALDSTYPTLVIDDPGGPWVTDPLFLTRGGVTIHIAPGVEIAARTGGYASGGACLLTLDRVTGVSIHGAGSVLRMNRDEYVAANPANQWRHVINVLSCSELTIEGVTCRDSGGDGIYLGRSTAAGAPTWSTDVVIRNVLADNNYRNGISVISVDGLLVEACHLMNSVGHDPQSGIDFEPNNPDEKLVDIVMRRCVVDGSGRYGLVFAMAHLDGSATPVSIEVSDCYVGANQPATPFSSSYYGPSIDFTAPKVTDPGGSVTVRDCLVRTGPNACVYAIYPKRSDGMALTFSRIVAENWGNASGQHYEPLCLLDLSVTPYGGVAWDNCVLVTDQSGTTFAAHRAGSTSTIADISGSMTMIGPHLWTESLGSPVTGRTLAVRNLTTPPATTVTMTAPSATVVRGADAQFTVSRSSGDVSDPLAVEYAISGTAVAGQDCDRAVGAVVIPPAATSRTLTIPTKADATSGRTITLTLTPAMTYTIGAAAAGTVTLA